MRFVGDSPHISSHQQHCRGASLRLCKNYPKTSFAFILTVIIACKSLIYGCRDARPCVSTVRFYSIPEYLHSLLVIARRERSEHQYSITKQEGYLLMMEQYKNIHGNSERSIPQNGSVALPTPPNSKQTLQKRFRK